MLKLVFVCSGHLCRSPMAAVIAERKLGQARIEAMVTSAGTLGIQGARPPQEALDAVAEVGLSLAAHRSQGISALLLKAATHVVVMAPMHEAELLAKDPNSGGKIRRLWEFATPPGRLEEIADPVGGPLDEFRQCRADLEQCLDGFVRSLR